LLLSGQATLGNTSSTLTMSNAVLDLGGTNQSIGTVSTLSTSATIENSGGSSVTFTIGTGNTTGGSFTGVFLDHSATGTGTLALLKVGTGSIGFGPGYSTATFTGGASVTGGTLALNGTASGGGVVKNSLVIGDGTDPAAVVDSGGVMHFTNSTNITVNNNGSLLLASTQTDSTKTLTVNQGGYVDLGGSTLDLQITANAALNMTAGIIQDGTFLPQNDGSINITAAPATSVISANMILSGLTPTITVAPSTGSNAPIGLLLSGTITSTNIGMLKVGSGILKITGSNSYGSTGGATTISAGTLLVDNASGSGTGERAVTVNGGGTLGGIGTIGGVAGYTLASVTATGSSVLGSAVIAPGDTNATTGAHVIGALTIGSSSQLNSGTLGSYSLLSIQCGPSNSSDELVVNGTLTLTAAANGTALALSSPTGTVPGTYVVASFGTLAGTFNSLTVDGVSQPTSEITYDHTADDITVTVTPEPTGAAATLFGAGTLLLARRRRGVQNKSALC
jgi:fibronectin-binding autotransporter adhesin